MGMSTPPRRVLVVDDNHDAADMITELLQLSGYDAVPSYDGRSALSVAAQFQPDVVFCDIGMPGMDGYQVAKQLRTMTALKDTRVVALTAWGDAKASANVVAAGFHHHLIKPASIQDILRQLT